MKYKLDDIDKKSGFKVPKGYFDNLSLKIQKRIEEEKPETVSIGLPSWSLAMAASMIAVLAFIFIFKNQKDSPEALLASISQEDLVAYLSQLEVDEYDLANAFPEETELIEFDDVNMLDALDIENESLDEILEEYNLNEEYLDI